MANMVLQSMLSFTAQQNLQSTSATAQRQQRQQQQQQQQLTRAGSGSIAGVSLPKAGSFLMRSPQLSQQCNCHGGTTAARPCRNANAKCVLMGGSSPRTNSLFS